MFDDDEYGFLNEIGSEIPASVRNAAMQAVGKPAPTQGSSSQDSSASPQQVALQQASAKGISPRDIERLSERISDRTGESFHDDDIAAVLRESVGGPRSGLENTHHVEIHNAISQPEFAIYRAAAQGDPKFIGGGFGKESSAAFTPQMETQMNGFARNPQVQKQASDLLAANAASPRDSALENYNNVALQNNMNSKSDKGKYSLMDKSVSNAMLAESMLRMDEYTVQEHLNIGKKYNAGYSDPAKAKEFDTMIVKYPGAPDRVAVITGKDKHGNLQFTMEMEDGSIVNSTIAANNENIKGFVDGHGLRVEDAVARTSGVHNHPVAGRSQQAQQQQAAGTQGRDPRVDPRLYERMDYSQSKNMPGRIMDAAKGAFGVATHSGGGGLGGLGDIAQTASNYGKILEGTKTILGRF